MDNISALPNHVLIIILTKLTLHNLVNASEISRKVKNACRSDSNLSKKIKSYYMGERELNKITRNEIIVPLLTECKEGSLKNTKIGEFLNSFYKFQKLKITEI